MAKILKHLVFGQKKNPPVPPRPDYEGNQTNNPRFSGPIYCNIPHSGNQQTVHFEQRNENQLIVFEEYSEPADLRAELEALNDDDCDDPLYSAPVDHDATSPFQHGETKDQEEEEDMYCVPYEHSEENDTVKSASQGVCKESEELEDNYDVVPTLSEEKENVSERTAYERSPSTTPADDTRPSGEYDEPWEWTVGARITSSLQSLHVSPSSPGGLSLDTEEHTYSEPAASESFLSDSESIDEDMTTRQRRMYETAFDSRVKRDIDDIDRLMQSPVLQGDLFRPRDAQVVRTASRSSFGSTSGSSNSSTPTHQPMVVHSRQSLRQLPRHFPLHFTPTERRKVTLIRDLSRSSSPQGEQFKVISGIEHSPKGFIAEFKSSSRTDNRVIPNYVNERKLSLTNHWGSNYRCSDRSSSQESMNIMDQRDDLSLLNGCREEHRMFPLGKSASRDSIDDRRYFPNGFAKNSLGRSVGENSPFSAKKAICGHQAIKVLPTENGKILAKARNKVTPTSVDQSPSNATNCSPMETSLSKNDEPECQRVARPCSLATESRLPDKTDQSPQNDDRPSGDYDLPWEFKSRGVFRPSVNGSISVPECLSHPAEVNSRGTNSSTTPPSTATAAVDSLEDVSSKMPGLQAHSSNDGNVAIVVEDTKSLPMKPAGPPARPSLNLNLNLNSNSPKKARQNLTLNFGCSALSVVGEKVDAGLTLEKQGWYHGSISRLDAENLLRVLKEGSYLVRNSESSKQDYSLSLKSARGFMHMKIVQSDGHYILGQFSKPFSSIPEMIHHYSINKLPIKGAEHMSLLYPVIDQLL